MSTRISPRKLVLACALLLTACDKAGGGAASSSPGEGPPKPEYATPFEAIDDVPEQLSAQVKWAAQPIEDAATLGNEIGALRASLKVDAATFESMCKVAFTDGKIEFGADAELAAHKAEIEATLAKIKQVGVDLKGIPGRVKVAGKNIGKLVVSTPGLALKATKDLKGQISTATGDQKLKLEADLKVVAGLPNQVKTEAVALKNDLAALPKKALTATQGMLAAFAGKPAAGGAAGGAAGTTPGEAGAATSDPSTPTTTQPTAQPALSGAAVAGAAKPAAVGAPPPPPPPAAAVGTAAASPGRAARLSILVKEARDCESRGDHLSAANSYEEAYFLDTSDKGMAFELGREAWKAKDCPRAMSYLEYFVQNADKTQHEAQLGQTTGILRELKTFDCPARTIDDEKAYAQTLTLEAEALGDAGDWGGAAASWAEAYQRVPSDHAFAYHVAVGSWEAHECGDAKTYLEHFTSVGDPRKHRRELKDTKRRLDGLAAGECRAWDPTQKDAHARQLFSQAQDLERKLDFRGAVDKYERAYLLLPNNHAFAWRIAEAAWNGYDCQTSDVYLRKFVAAATDPKLAPDVQRANVYLARIDAAGCPNALWTDAAAGGGGGDGEAPPPSGAQAGAKSAGCSVTDPESARAWWLLFVAWVGVRARARHATS